MRPGLPFSSTSGAAGPPRDRPGLAASHRHPHRQTGHRPADALLIRPDAYIAWAAATGEPGATASPTPRKALSIWFGTPLAE